MFFESRTQSSTRHRRLRYFLLLSLRLLLLLLLILAFANPFINRNAAAMASNRLVLLVVDNSFSMRAGTRLADAKDAAMSVLSGKGAARASGGGVRFATAAHDAAHRGSGCAARRRAGHSAWRRPRQFRRTGARGAGHGRIGPHSHRASCVQRHAARRPGRHLRRHGAARQRQTGDACGGHQGAAQLDGGIGGRARDRSGARTPSRFTCRP